MNQDVSPFTQQSVASWTNDTLTETLQRLVSKERSLTANVLMLMAEVMARKLYLHAACPSMFAYATLVLRMSEAEAYRRIRVAKVLNDFPVLIEQLIQGHIHLSGLTVLAPVLTPENCTVLINKAYHKSTRDIEAMVAALDTQEDVVSSFRKLPSLAPATMQVGTRPPGELFARRVSVRDSDGSSQTDETNTYLIEISMNNSNLSQRSGGDKAPDIFESPVAASQLAPSKPKVVAKFEPLNESRYVFKCTVSKRIRDKFEQLYDLMVHENPDRDAEILLEKMLDTQIAKRLKEKYAVGMSSRARGENAEPNKSKSPARSRTIPAAIRRRVYQRDAGQCTYREKQGRRCSARVQLEFHHHEPFGRGGEHHVDNISLRCRGHNMLAACRDYGATRIAAKMAQG